MDYFAENFNTPLTPEQQAQFNQWVVSQSKVRGRDLAKDMHDYDLQGYWLAMGSKDKGEGHMPDTFKKPNHPTFSDESQYHGTPDGMGGKWQGGKWVGDDKSGWSFQVTDSMLKKTHSRAQIQQYFADNEPDAGVVMPTVNVR